MKIRRSHVVCARKGEVATRRRRMLHTERLRNLQTFIYELPLVDRSKEMRRDKTCSKRSRHKEIMNIQFLVIYYIQ